MFFSDFESYSSCCIKSYVKKQRCLMRKREKNAAKSDELACGAAGGPVILLGSGCVAAAHARGWGVGLSRQAQPKGQGELWQLGPGSVRCGKPLAGWKGAGGGGAALGRVLKHRSSAWPRLSLGVTHVHHGLLVRALVLHALGGGVQGWPLFECQPSADFSGSRLGRRKRAEKKRFVWMINCVWCW